MVDRREFLAGIGGLGAGLGLGFVSHWLPFPSPEVGPAWSPGTEESITSTCTLCPSHCGIRGRVVDGKLVRVEGNPLHPISRGGLCPMGLAGIQLLYHPARLTGPVERVGSRGSAEFRKISWEEALDRVGGTLSDLQARGEEHRAVWIAGDVTDLRGELLRRFARFTGTPHLLVEDYDDASQQVMRLTQGIESAPAFDIEASDFILSFGAGGSEAWWCLPQISTARNAPASRRPRWVQVDVRHSRTAASADEWIGVRPGSYGTLALGIAYLILKEGLYDADAAREIVAGLEDSVGPDGEVVEGFRTLCLRHGRTEEVSRRTGVPPEEIVRLAKAFGAAERPLALWDQCVTWRTGGLADAMMVHTLNLLVGASNRPGGILVKPPLPVPSLDAAVEARPDQPPGPPTLTAQDWAERIASGEFAVQALFLYHANPVASAANRRQVTAALDRVPLVVSFSPFLDDSAKHADLVLPDHIYLERWQDATAPASVPIPVWGVVQPMIQPLHDTRSTSDVLLQITQRLGGDVAAAFPWATMEEIVEQRGRALAGAHGGGVLNSEFQRGELRELEARGWWIPHGLSEGDFWQQVRSNGGWFDPYYDYNDRSVVSKFPDGKVRLYSPEAREAIARAAPAPVEGFLPIPNAADREPPADDRLVRLIPYRVMTLASGSTPLMPWLLENLGLLSGTAWETWVEMSPETARHLQLSADQMVRVESGAGSFTARLRIYAGAQPGVVHVPYGLHTRVEGWGQSDGVNPLAAVGDGRDPLTGLPDWYSTRARVEPA